MRAIKAATVLVVLGCTPDAGPPTTAPSVALRLSILTQPVALTAGSVMEPPLRVVVRDALHQVVTSPSITITVALEDATLLGSLTRPTVDGVATFDDLTVPEAGFYVLKLSATDLESVTTSFFEVRPAPPAGLAFVNQPPAVVVAGTMILPAIRVNVLDEYHNVVVAADNQVTLSLAESAGPLIPLQGTLTRPVVEGAATFDDLATDSVGRFLFTATSPSLAPAKSDPLRVARAAGFRLASISIGLEQTCGLDASGQAWCWGSGVTTPSKEAEGLTFRSLSAGGGGFDEDLSFTCGVTTAGEAYCWGSSLRGALGDGRLGYSAHPAEAVIGGLEFTSLSANGAHACALTSAGAAYCWGSNTLGELGVGDTLTRAEPTAVAAGDLRFVRIAAGDFHTCATTADRTYCWGFNGADQTRSTVPRAVVGSVAYEMIGAGTEHSCGLTVAGAASCWGDNSTGQLGTGTYVASPTPVAVWGSRVFTALASKGYTTCGVSAGQGYCWGWNDWGQLGVGYVTPRTDAQQSFPLHIAADIELSAIAVGVWHACGLTTDGVPYCWGQNSAGQLGNDSGKDSAVPVPVIP